MRYPEPLLDEIRARLSVSQVVARKVALKRAGREFKGLSPFKVEKTPSFTVNDAKGFYHCFASGEHGDIFTFLMKTEGLSFPEAIERLAHEAGVQLPKKDEAQERQFKHQTSLYEVMSAAAEFYRQQLSAELARPARLYLEKRGISASTLAEFGFGYAHDNRTALKSRLLKMGFTENQLLDCGLVIRPDSGGTSFDRFRNRIMIPIQDPQGRVIAFGGRSLDPEVQPKYLNSPETALFHKGSVVFNFHRARQAAFDADSVVVVEGYIDAIAVYQAGIKHVVATLGTAFTERQIGLLWRLAESPIVCFDGDKAGEAAAYRALDRILPELREGRSFRFAVLDNGEDPDDLVRDRGRQGFEQVLANALPLHEVLWRRELKSTALDTPEAKAALERRLNAVVSVINEPFIRRHYLQSMRVRLSKLFWDLERQSSGRTVVHKLARPGEPELERLILGMAVEYPELFEMHWETFRDLPMTELHAAFREALIEVVLTADNCLVATIYERLDPRYFFVLNQIHGDAVPEERLPRGHRLFLRCPILTMEPSPDFVEQYLLLLIDLLSLNSEEREIQSVLKEFHAEMSEANEHRLLSLSRSVETRRTSVRLREHELLEQAGEIRARFRYPAPIVKSVASSTRPLSFGA